MPEKTPTKTSSPPANRAVELVEAFDAQKDYTELILFLLCGVLLIVMLDKLMVLARRG